MLSVLKDFRKEYKDAVERIAKEKETYEAISKRIEKGTAREYDQKELVITKETISYLDGKIDTLRDTFDKILQLDNTKVIKTILIDTEGNEIILHNGTVIKSDIERCKEEEVLSLVDLYTLAKEGDFTITMFSIQPNIDSWIG